ncbi:MAG: NAD(P)-binding protein [Chitinivibrionales bacterium]|nr:NAD(P)-binding protein [Chitinivibrionales bacterium]MBD3357039.1 NAD(P)-binding protein [Chitinivibrionales bacterium]
MNKRTESRSIVIIGGGLGGLAVGSYLLMNGFRTHILEQANQCGGVAVTWDRKGYRFDGATNYLPGSSPALNAHNIIGEIIDLHKLRFYDYPEFIRIEHEGEVFRVYTDAERLRKEMLRIAPEDRKVIDEFIGAVKRFGAFNLPFEKAPETFTVIDALSFLAKNFPLLMFRQKWGTISVERYARRFRNRAMRAMFQQIFPHHEHFAVMAPIAPLGWMNRKVAGYPLGGSLKIIELMEERYRSLGGTIEFFKPVKQINVKDGAATGVTCDDDRVYDADIVVSAADLHETLFELLGGAFTPRGFVKRFESYHPFSSLVQVSLGIKRTFDGEAEKLNMPLDKPLHMGNHTARDMMVRILNFDPVYAPTGKTSVIVQLRTEDCDYWCALRNEDRNRYNQEKQHVAEVVTESLERRFAGVRKNVEVVDVATPATYVRYTRLWKGAHQGWAPTPGVIGRPQPKTLPGLRNFYLTGQWESPAGGIPAVIAVGRQVAQIICKREGKRFRGSVEGKGK